MINRWLFLLFLCPWYCLSQTLTGTVIDKVTQQPLETVAIYFDNTTIGTTTDQNGQFSISYTDAVQSTLVFSYLGYEKIFISDYRLKSHINVELVEADNALDEVHIAYDDGLTRRQKLRLFRKEFLGVSKYGKSCKILNEDDLVLKYDKENKALYADSKVALIIVNKALDYKITYDLMDFEINFNYVNERTAEFTVKSVFYYGTSFYKNLEDSGQPKTVKSRARVYKGSVQHFMRSLYNENLREEDYLIFFDGFVVKEWSYFNIEIIAESNFKKVTLKDKVSILYSKNFQSELQVDIDEFYVDIYGNYTPIEGIYFSGAMGKQRIGDTLPLDYGILK
ncbi:carboxypeptidase-like regulatory domain-containing protein [Winogradskyella eckloniae]|uniref:carboxypeptidase-like regulatory domain-containing protein n=1 Tax=Winogradskyella eckloniae TaxID=1089306 RepID=UPI0015664BB9|nr:carboxypeptidase-like regulatory domain-containing protein [Winogradskyella eckloniae]NRD18826.1 carboxypeptidase-like regulatory domain-containing protein [Winogradskyella eckloniae]